MKRRIDPLLLIFDFSNLITVSQIVSLVRLVLDFHIQLLVLVVMVKSVDREFVRDIVFDLRLRGPLKVLIILSYLKGDRIESIKIVVS